VNLPFYSSYKTTTGETFHKRLCRHGDWAFNALLFHSRYCLAADDPFELFDLFFWNFGAGGGSLDLDNVFCDIHLTHAEIISSRSDFPCGLPGERNDISSKAFQMTP
jgi:hypothetical protein